MLKFSVLLSCALLAKVSAVHAADDLRGYTCAQVRQAVVNYGGPEKAEAMARSQGGTDREIAAARRCLIRPKHFRRS
jgi:hypothetical protein